MEKEFDPKPIDWDDWSIPLKDRNWDDARIIRYGMQLEELFRGREGWKAKWFHEYGQDRENVLMVDHYLDRYWQRGRLWVHVDGDGPGIAHFQIWLDHVVPEGHQISTEEVRRLKPLLGDGWDEDHLWIDAFGWTEHTFRTGEIKTVELLVTLLEPIATVEAKTEPVHSLPLEYVEFEDDDRTWVMCPKCSQMSDASTAVLCEHDDPTMACHECGYCECETREEARVPR